jgi:large subunit ribosomal protein L21
MYAVIEESGGQRKVAVNDEFLIDLKDSGEAATGSKIAFDKVLVVGKPDGSAKIGQPYVFGATVTAEVTESEVKGDKLYIYHFEPKKAWKKKTGHRQRYTKVKVTAING